MDLIEERSEEITMAGNKKYSGNKTWADSTETEKIEKTISKKRSEPSLDKNNPKDIKITLTVPKSDEESFSSMSRLSHKDDKIPGKKKRENTRTFSHCK